MNSFATYDVSKWIDEAGLTRHPERAPSKPAAPRAPDAGITRFLFPTLATSMLTFALLPWSAVANYADQPIRTKADANALGDDSVYWLGVALDTSPSDTPAQRFNSFAVEIGKQLRSGALVSISEESANLAKEALARTLHRGWVSQVARSVSKLTD
ncbi:MAG: hypothetical protein M3N91_09215 [Pseudomonadota bacterium]|jgi:hypothetical protein|nr:hypothetical protein [Pseudomonadota bacterium]